MLNIVFLLERPIWQASAVNGASRPDRCNSGHCVICQEIHVGGAPQEQDHAVPHQGGCSGSRDESCQSQAITGDKPGDATQNLTDLSLR